LFLDAPRAAMAISGGVRDPMFSPMGGWTRAIWSAGTPNDSKAAMWGAV